jgi:2-methylcitrate dehydratase
LTGIAVHDHAPRAVAEAARQAAFLALMDALACAFKALQDAACTRQLGSLVPGATMAFGARVPGTSHQLDPVQAAFNIGTMASWLQENDPALATVAGDLSDNLGAILAVADYRARKAIAEGASPPLVRDLLSALVRAHEHASLEWARWLRESGSATAAQATDATASAAARCALTRIASAAAATSLLDGAADHVTAAVLIARREARPTGYAGTVPGLEGHERWRIGDATSRGVRLAFVALAGPTAPRSPTPPSDETTTQLAVMTELEQAWRTVAATPSLANRIRDRFAASVTTHFPAGQAGRILALFADRDRIEVLPVNELVSMTVRN